MGITVKIAGVDRTEYVDARSLSIIDELTSRVNSASFLFICNDIALAPTAGQAVLIEEGVIKLFSGRILTKEEDFLPPNLLKYQIECIDNTRDLDKKLVIESYLNQKAGDIIKDIITKYTSGFTTTNVSDGPTITRIAFDYIQASEAIIKIAETCGYEWYVDYDKDIYFFFKTDYPAPFELNDNQENHKELIVNTDISQLRNRVYVKSEKYETLDFTELFIGDGSTITWTCKYQANALPAPSLKLEGVAKTVGWDGVDNPDDYDFMLNANTKVLSLGTYQSTPADDDEIVITYGADVPIIIRWDDEDSIDAVKAIEGGDGIFEFCITDNNIDTKEWAIDAAKANLLQNANPIIQGNFVTNRSDIKSGQIITLNSTKRNINQDFLVQKVELIRVDVHFMISYKPAAIATINYKPAVNAEIPYKPVAPGEYIYYIYHVTIATKLKGLEDLLLQLLYQSSESLKRDTEAPAIPSGLALSTGMGSITQASLAWLKATWNVNTEDDFSHYELKYKKTAYSDFGLVTTTNASFIWTGLEQNIEYEVYIRAVDIYGNRSAWSSQQTQTTATDSDTPAQITGAVATAILAGIKITWTGATEGNIAGYIVERQESDDGTTWTGAWTERVRLDAYMWLDLLLTYTKYYRYRIKTFTQTGTEGSTSTPTADSIAPLKTGANDIVAKCITAAQIYGTNLAVIFADLGTITAGNITLNTAGFVRTSGKNNYADDTAGFWLGYDGAYKFYIGNATQYLKWTGSALSIKGSITLINTIPNAKVDGLGDLALVDSLAYGDITGTKPPSNADVTLTAIQGELSLAGGGLVLASAGAKIRGGQTAYGVGTGFWLGDVSGISKLSIGSASAYLKWTGSALSIKGSIQIMGGSGIANLSDAGALATLDNVAYAAITGAKPPSNADYFGGVAGSLAYYNMVSAALLDSTIIIGGYIKTSLLTATNIRTGTLRSVRIQVGGGTNEDIYFEDSGIRLYDAGGYALIFARAGLASAGVSMGSDWAAFVSAGTKVVLGNYLRNLIFWSGGTLQLPNLSSPPVGHTGDMAFDNGDRQTKLYTQGTWRRYYTYAGW